MDFHQKIRPPSGSHELGTEVPTGEDIRRPSHLHRGHSVSIAAHIVRPGTRRLGQEFPTGPALLAASGAAFTAIVLGQAANAFACRSVERPAWATHLRTNPLLIAAILAELSLLLVLLYVPPVAHLLGHAGPSIAGFAVAVTTIPAVLLADALHKLLRSRRIGDFRL